MTYGPYDAYMAASNLNKCYACVMLVVAAHNDLDDADDWWAAGFIAGWQFQQLTKHLQTCPDCRIHPLLQVSH